ncbi:MAG: hypothetical protein RL065_1255, partial [Bacteroidota bacterium]
MIKQFYAFVICIILSHYAMADNKIILSGKIINKENKQAINKATIYFPDLKTGISTNQDGMYSIGNLPKTKLLIQISSIGFQNHLETIDISQSQELNIELEPSVKEITEVVITGLSQSTERNRTSIPISIVSHISLLQNTSTNIIDALAKQPGISQITTGSGISKPVIRGLGFNRVVVVNDGVKQEGQQWGDEHGIEIDEFSVNKVEIIKGPASLSYGSDAMAGVINMISFPTMHVGEIKGTILTNYQTNNGLIAYSANLSGNSKNIVWSARVSQKNAHSYQNKLDGKVLNSSFSEHTISGLIGIHKNWGFSHLNFSAFQLMPGIIEGERDSATGKFTTFKKTNDSSTQSIIVSSKELNNYQLLIPYQKVNHYKMVLSNNIYIKGKSLKTNVGFQQNHRKEYGDILLPKDYQLYFLMKTISYDVKYNLIEKNKTSITIGVNGMFQNSKNKGSEFLIPEYNLFDIGIFTIAKKQLGRFDINGGIRYDTRKLNVNELWLNANDEISTSLATNINQKFKALNNQFNGISGSLGTAFKISNHSFTKLNISKGFRAPNIAEISSNGKHEGTLRYEIGNNNLKSESSLQTDFIFGINTKHVTAELSIFDNYINHFIYLQKLNSENGKDSINDNVSTFKFNQTKANLYGGEVSIDIHPHPFDWLHFENSISFVRAKQINQPDSLSNLPFIPAPRLQSEIKFEKKKLNNHLVNTYFKFELEYNFKQNNILSAFNTETKTNDYTLLNTSIGGDFQQ